MQTNKTFSKNVDVDREILLKLSDEDLLKTCRLNQYLFYTVCNDEFFHRRLQLTYPDTLTLHDPKKYKNYRNFYLNMIYYISRLSEKPFEYYYVGGDPQKQLKIFKASLEGNSINYQELLLASSREGELDIVKFLLNKGVNLQADNKPLEAASIFGYSEIVKYLVENGANVTDNALIWASRSGNLELVKYLVDHGANIHANNENSLLTAVVSGYLDIVKYLVERGANFHLNNDNMLILASHYGRLEIVKYLVDKGANINAENEKNGNALQQASSQGHLEIVKYLINRGAIERNALKGAAAYGHLEIVKYLLLSQRIDINTISSALHDARLYKHSDIVRYLEIWLSNSTDIISKISTVISKQ